jgi:LysR family glycine cleavage system transcriptional activator
MKRSLLPLNALRMFESAARHLSFTKAADELAVTPAAVGQQIRHLEEVLGVVLFRRTARALVLTPEAEEALPLLKAAFEKLDEAVATLRHAQHGKALTVSVPPSFAAKWLIPRVSRYLAERPELQVRVLASEALTDFSAENVDMAIRYGAGGYPDLLVEKLMDEAVVAVAAPSLVDQSGLTDLTRLADVTLIHDVSSSDDPSCPTWAMWLKAAGVAHPDPERGLHVNQSALAIEAAAAGKGVALAKRSIAGADLAAGRLVPLSGGGARVDFAYWLVMPPAAARLAKVKEFVGWLRQETAWAWEI